MSRRSLKALAASSAVLAALSLASAARADSDANSCHGVDFDLAHPLVVAKVTAAPRLGFVKNAEDDPSCPSAAPACRAPAYVVPGDLVLTGRVNGRYTCVAYLMPNAAKPNWTNGWLPNSGLQPVAPAAAPKQADWLGEWEIPSASITIKRADGGRLKIDGLATYQAALNVHTGVLEAVASAANGMLAFADDGSEAFEKADAGACLVRMTRVGAYLAVEDNGGCGGVMVTFTGLYRRK